MLVLDEPTFGQDANTWRELARLIADLRDEGVGVVAVTHDETFIDAVADSRFALAVDGAAAMTDVSARRRSHGGGVSA
jgi:energy-coupling factor transport system ATP-binding protein